MAAIRSVAFDANGVLYYRDTEVVDTVVDAARARGIKLPPNARELYVDLMNVAFRGTLSREAMIERILESWQVEAESERQAVAAAITAASRVIRIYPGVVETLARLRALGIGTGVITNSFQSAEEKWMWFRNHGLAPHLERIISSIEAGVAKPAPAIYLKYVEECGLTPGEVAFVGHDLGELKGAEKAGLVCLAFRPDQPGTFLPEFHDFRELPRLLGLEAKAV
ncbi:MAG: HAD family hydrolase [Methanocella sp.]